MLIALLGRVVAPARTPCQEVPHPRPYPRPLRIRHPPGLPLILAPEPGGFRRKALMLRPGLRLRGGERRGAEGSAALSPHTLARFYPRTRGFLVSRLLRALRCPVLCIALMRFTPQRPVYAQCGSDIQPRHMEVLRGYQFFCHECGVQHCRTASLSFQSVLSSALS